MFRRIQPGSDLLVASILDRYVLSKLFTFTCFYNSSLILFVNSVKLSVLRFD